jgi:hypothetical protein
MELRTLIINPGILALSFTGFYYGYKFLQRGNALLGFEWLILGYSATNQFLTFNGWNETAGTISWVCDAFSRSVGIPLIAVLGFMKLTHKIEPSLRSDVLVFVGGFLLAVILYDSKALAPFLPTVYLWLMGVWSAYHLYFSHRLWKVDLRKFAVINALAAFAIIFVAMLEGVIHIPNDEKNLFLNFFFIAHWSWALIFGFAYYAYIAYEDRMEIRRMRM